jgi:hypothetical protein
MKTSEATHKPSSRDLFAGPMVQLPREMVIPLSTCGGPMGPAPKARDDGYFEGPNRATRS